MSKMGCTCGAIISDTVYPCPTEGTVIGEQDFEQMLQSFVADVVAFLEAVATGERESWLLRYFSSGYPHDVSDAEVIDDILGRLWRSSSLSIAECGSCGRLWIQQPSGENQYRSFRPDEGGYAALLAARFRKPDGVPPQ
jgi:hypothetical protein